MASTACAGSLILGLAGWKAPTHAEDAPHFAYTGDAGPAFWGELSHDWAACSGRGGRQTPIDITPSRGLPTLPILTPLQLNLRPSPIDLVNNGHTLQSQAHSLPSRR